MAKVIYGVVIALILGLSAVVLFQRKEILSLSSQLTSLKLSNESYQAQKVKDDKFIEDLGALTIKKMQDAEKLAKDFDAISRKYRNTHTVPIKKGEVLSDELRQELRNDISKPLPFPATDSVRQ